MFGDRSGVFHDRSGVFDDRSGVFQFYTDAKLPLLWLDLKDIKKIKVQNKHLWVWKQIIGNIFKSSNLQNQKKTTHKKH